MKEAVPNRKITVLNRFDTLNDGVSILDLDLNIVKVNATIEQWFPYSHPLVGKKCYEAYHKRTTPCDICPAQQTLKTGEFLYELIQETGTSGEVIRCLDFSAIPLIDPVTKEVQGVVQYFHSVTEKKKNIEAQKVSEAKFRNLVEHIPAVIYMAAPNNYRTRLHINPQAETILGFTPADYETEPNLWALQLHPEDRDRVLAEVAQCHITGEPFTSDYRMVARDGRTVWIHDSASLVHDLSGRPLFLQGVMRDISSSKKLEEALKESEEKYRRLVQQIPALVFKGYDDWSIDCFDNKIEELTGYPKEDFDARRLKWCDLIPAEELPYIKQVFQAALQEDQSYIREHRIRKKDGEYAWVQCRGQIFCDDQGDVEYISGVTFDITAQKQAEIALMKSEELYRLLAEHVSDVLWTVSLDLKFTYISPSVKQLLGFTPEEIIGKALGEVLPPASLGLALEIFGKEMARERQGLEDLNRSWVFELEERHKDNSIIWTEVKASFIRDSNNQPIGILGVTRDITQRKQAQEALRRREAVLEAVSFAAEKFLKTEFWEENLIDILGRLGQAMEVSRVYIFENHADENGTLLTSWRFEWVATGIEPQMYNPETQNFPWRAAGMGRWADLQARGQTVYGVIKDFPVEEQAILAPKGIKSIVAVPILVEEYWWGFVGFDECLRDREWAAVEIEALKTAASILGTAILHDQSKKALRESEEKLRSLNYQLLDAQERERKRLATELHNVFGHDLLLLKLKLESLQNELPPEQASQKMEVKQIIRSLQESVKNIRHLYQDLSPGDLEDLGLTAALHILLEEFAMAKRITWQAQLDNLDALFDLPLQTTIYRLVQEGLTNIGKHAKAKHVSLRAIKEQTQASFIIEDDGKGFNLTDVLAAKKTMGLLSMEERVKTWGGSIEIQTQKTVGTRISFTMPISEGGN